MVGCPGCLSRLVVAYPAWSSPITLGHRPVWHWPSPIPLGRRLSALAIVLSGSGRCLSRLVVAYPAWPSSCLAMAVAYPTWPSSCLAMAVAYSARPLPILLGHRPVWQWLLANLVYHPS